MNGNQQLEQALLTGCLSGVSRNAQISRAGSFVDGFYLASCMAAVTVGEDFGRLLANPINIPPPRQFLGTPTTAVKGFSPTMLEPGLRVALPKRVTLPLVRSKKPGSVSLTNAQIEDLLD